jgi:hypothetical protein
VQVVAELLNARDGLPRSIGRIEVAREEDSSGVSWSSRDVTRWRTEGDVADILGLAEAFDMPHLERRLAVRVQDLGGALDGRLPSGVDKFLCSMLFLTQSKTSTDRRTCRKTLPKMRSVSSLKTVLKTTVTRSMPGLMYIASSGLHATSRTEERRKTDAKHL